MPYQGPGDVITPQAVHWWGLRAYSAATAGTKCVRIIDETTTTQQDFNTLANGSLDTASIATFLGAHVGKIVALYDQIGGANVKDLTQATDANRPVYATNAFGVYSSAQFSSANSTELDANLTFSPAVPIPVPWTIMSFGRRAGHTSNDVLHGFSGNIFMYGTTTADQWDFVPDGAHNMYLSPLTDGNFHAFVMTANATPTTTFYADALSTSIGFGSGQIDVFNLGGSGAVGFFTGDALEAAIWSSALSSGDAVAIINNALAYSFPSLAPPPTFTGGGRTIFKIRPRGWAW